MSPNPPSSANEFEEQFSSLGFVPGVVRGARSFKVDEHGWLTGLVYPQIWESGENIAACRRGQSGWGPYSYAPGGWVPTAAFNAPEEKKPHKMRECKCGFHAYYDGSNDYYKQEHVAGVIEGYGDTIIGTRGFRSSKARIVALWVPEDIDSLIFVFGVGSLRRRYDDILDYMQLNYPQIPLFQTFEDMVAEFPPDSGTKEEERNG